LPLTVPAPPPGGVAAGLVVEGGLDRLEGGAGGVLGWLDGLLPAWPVGAVVVVDLCGRGWRVVRLASEARLRCERIEARLSADLCVGAAGRALARIGPSNSAADSDSAAAQTKSTAATLPLKGRVVLRAAGPVGSFTR
jgi:hypothetical protein